MSNATHAMNIDGIDRPCAICDTTSIHFEGGQDHNYVPGQITETSPAWEAIRAEAWRIGWPQHFTSDLYRDYEILATEKWVQQMGPRPNRFLWALRESGTHIILLDATRDRQRAWSFVNAIGKNHKDVRWYEWRDGQLNEIDEQTARALAGSPTVVDS